MTFGENLKELRQKKGISSTDLAEAANIAAPQISKYEAGVTVPNVITAVAIAKRLGVTVERLVCGEE